MSYYKYRPLQKPRNIRLLLLQPSECFEDPILCNCIEVELDADVPYTALSYTWGVGPSGDASFSRGISVDGAVMPVTQVSVPRAEYLSSTNLFEALQYLRTNATLRLWVDAVCINQRDDSEKTRQVAMMSEIYTRAQQVIAWLGLGPCSEVDEAANIVMRCLHKEVTEGPLDSKCAALTNEEAARNEPDVFAFSTKKPVLRFRHTWTSPDNWRADQPWCDLCTAWISQQRKWPDIIQPWEPGGFILSQNDEDEILSDWNDEQFDWYFSLMENVLVALAGLLTRRYWNRRWIVQEINCPKSDAIVLRWGKHKIPLRHFRAILDVIISAAIVEREEAISVRKTLDVRDIKDLGALVASLDHTECFDPRDCIYALLGLSDNTLFMPDYSLSAIDVYVRYAGMLIKQDRVMDVLNACYEDPSNVIRDALSSQLPSWVPDLRYECPGEPPRSHSQDKSSDCHFAVHARSLECQWFLLGICRLHPGTTPFDTTETKFTEISDDRHYLDDLMDPAPSVNESIPIVAKDERAPEEIDVMLYWTADDSSYTTLEAIIDRQTAMPRAGDLLCTMQQPRPHTLFTLEESYDHVAYPYVLRPSKSEPETYTIQGSCAVLYREGSAHPSKLCTTRLI